MVSAGLLCDIRHSGKNLFDRTESEWWPLKGAYIQTKEVAYRNFSPGHPEAQGMMARICAWVLTSWLSLAGLQGLEVGAWAIARWALAESTGLPLRARILESSGILLRGTKTQPWEIALCS